MKTVILSLHFSRYALVIKRNVSPVKLFSKNDTARMVETLFALQFIQLAALPRRNFSYVFFLGIFRVTILLSKNFEKVLKDYKAKLLYQRLAKNLNIKHLYVLYKGNILERNRKASRKTLMLQPCLSTNSI